MKHAVACRAGGEARKQAATHLRAHLFPRVEPGFFGPIMVADLFEALNGIPGATVGEKKAAANMAPTHTVCPAWLKGKRNRALAGLEKQ